MRRISEERFNARTSAMAAKIARENMCGVSVAKSAAIFARRNFGNRSRSTNTVRDVLTEFTEYVGGSVGYVPNADGGDARTLAGLRNLSEGRVAFADGGVDAYVLTDNKTDVPYADWISLTENGRFLCYWYRGEDGLKVEPLRNMDTSMYSLEPRRRVEAGEADTSVVTEPYIYGGKTLMVEYASPIVVDGKFAGQVAIDRDLKNIAGFVRDFKTFEGEEFFLISPQSRIIAATRNDAVRTVSIDDLYADAAGNFVTSFLKEENGQFVRDEVLAAKAGLPKLKTIYRDILRAAFDGAKNSMGAKTDGGGIVRFTDPQTRRTYCVANATVQPGNWVLVHMAPEMEIMKAVYGAAAVDIFGAVGIMIVFAGFSIAILRVLGRIEDAECAAEKLASGDFDEMAPKKTLHVSDETGRIMAAMAKIASQLRAFSASVDDVSARMTLAEAGAENSAEAYDACKAGFEESFEMLSDTSAKIAGAGSAISAEAEKLRRCADESADEALKTAAVSESIKASVDEISKGAVAVSRSFGAVVDRSDSIDKAVAGISKIADETNLLSLNASIEAEKAGSHGAGFAVVAREIGKLSEQTAAAAADIERIMRELRGAAVTGASQADTFARKSGAGASGTEDLAEALRALDLHLRNLSLTASGVCDAARRQTDGARSLDETVANLSDVSRRANAMAGGVFASRDEIRRLVRRISAEVEALKKDKRGR